VPWNQLGAGRVQVEFGRHEQDAPLPDDDPADDIDDDPDHDIAEDGSDTAEDQTTTARGGRL
jgi:ribosome maturation factor RimP